MIKEAIDISSVQHKMRDKLIRENNAIGKIVEDSRELRSIIDCNSEERIKYDTAIDKVSYLISSTDEPKITEITENLLLEQLKANNVENAEEVLSDVLKYAKFRELCDEIISNQRLEVSIIDGKKRIGGSNIVTSDSIKKHLDSLGIENSQASKSMVMDLKEFYSKSLKDTISFLREPNDINVIKSKLLLRPAPKQTPSSGAISCSRSRS